MYKFCNYKIGNYIFFTEPGNLIHWPEILPGTWQNWMYCLYPRSSYMTDFLPMSAPYYSLLHGRRLKRLPCLPTFQRLLILVQYTCTVYVYCMQCLCIDLLKGPQKGRYNNPNSTSTSESLLPSSMLNNFGWTSILNTSYILFLIGSATTMEQT